MFKAIYDLFNIGRNVVKAEAEEIKKLNPTAFDKKVAKLGVKVVEKVAGRYFITIPNSIKVIMEEAFAYVVCDAREGMKNKENLIISRVFRETKKHFVCISINHENGNI